MRRRGLFCANSSVGSALLTRCTGLRWDSVRFDSTRLHGPAENPNAPTESLKERAERMLWDVERRVTVAPDYGSVFVCQMINDSRLMLRDIETDLRRWGLADDEELKEKIEEIRDLAIKIEYDLELD